MGSWAWFWLLCASGIGLPVAVLYLLTGTIRIDTDVDDPEQLAEDLYSGKLARKQWRVKRNDTASQTECRIRFLTAFFQQIGAVTLRIPAGILR